MSLIALAGSFSASASPTFVTSCFETKAEAEQQQAAFADREVDNSKSTALDKSVKDLVAGSWNNVELSAIELLLGKPQSRALYASDTATHTWSLGLAYTPSATGITYDASRGYCVSTRRAPFGVIEYSWTEDFQDSPYGTLERHFIYN